MDIRSQAAANCAGAYRTWALRTGNLAQTWAGMSVNDLGLARANPVDGAFLLAPIDSAEQMGEQMDRVEAFFAQRPGGPIQLWSPWPTPSLVERGYAVYEVPGMLREPGGQGPSAPPELAIGHARSTAELAAAGRLINEAFRCEAPEPERLVTRSLIGEDFEVFVGRVGDQVVSTATAYVSDGFCGVYAVATDAAFRGRGFGAALTWAATTFRADLPATLQASEMGHPVYRGMGYRDFTTFWLWQGPRPGGGGAPDGSSPAQ